MQHIAATMKACGEEVQSQSEIATYYVGPPTNVEWDVKKSTTVRSPYEGIVTFTLPERSEETEKTKHSKSLHQRYTDAQIMQTAYGRQGHYQYEFDLGNGSPDLVTVRFFNDKTKQSELVPSGGRGPTCWEKAARSAGKSE
jgi:hypothetical protein